MIICLRDRHQSAVRALWAAVVFALSASICSSAELAPEAKTYIDGLLSAESTARTDTLALLGFLLAAIALVTTFAGFSVYKFLERSISARILDDIRESEARNLIRLGKRSYDLFSDQTLAKEARLAALMGAITNTDYALSVIEKLKRNETDRTRNDLLALAGTNLGYYYIELAELMASASPGLDVSHYHRTAIIAVDRVTVNVEVAQRNRNSDILDWWNVVESRLAVLFKATPNPDKTSFKAAIKELVENTAIPYEWRIETKKIWDVWLA